MSLLHKNAASGRWQQMSLAEQIANIGSEVGRAAKWQSKDEQTFSGAVARALELFDLTLGDSRWRRHSLELGRLKEVFCDGVLGGEEYSTDLHDLEKYFYPFMNLVASRIPSK